MLIISCLFGFDAPCKKGFLNLETNNLTARFVAAQTRASRPGVLLWAAVIRIAEGNKNAFKHGRYSAEAVARRRFAESGPDRSDRRHVSRILRIRIPRSGTGLSGARLQPQRRLAAIPSVLLQRTGPEDWHTMIVKSVIACPNCGYASEEIMPTDACQFFYDCKGCGARLKPKAGDCCVFCSYGSVPCPPVQQGSKPC